MTTKKHLRLTVGGMSCGNCSAAVTKALQAVAGVKKVKVTLDPGIAEVKGKDLDGATLVKAVVDAGFEAELTGER
jgi:Cu+-exporting ATPase